MLRTFLSFYNARLPDRNNTLPMIHLIDFDFQAIPGNILTKKPLEEIIKEPITRESIKDTWKHYNQGKYTLKQLTFQDFFQNVYKPIIQEISMKYICEKNMLFVYKSCRTFILSLAIFDFSRPV
jgi:hypothetical protein